MHKFATTALALAAGVSLALAMPLAASATPVHPASSIVSVSAASAPAAVSKWGFPVDNHGKDHFKPHPPKPTKPAYPPTKPPKPPKPPWFPPPFYWGGWWWFPFYFPAHTFHPGSIVHCFFTGNGGVRFHATFVATESGSIDLGTAADDGSLTAQVRASGTDIAGQALNVTLIDSAGTTVNQTVTVPKEAAQSAAGSLTSADPGSLASTGSYISLATVWGAVGLVALGAGFVTMRSVVRRKDRAKA